MFITCLLTFKARYLILFNPLFHFVVFNFFFILPNVYYYNNFDYSLLALLGMTSFSLGFFYFWREYEFVEAKYKFKASKSYSYIAIFAIVLSAFVISVFMLIAKGVSIVEFVKNPIATTSSFGKSNLALEALKNALIFPLLSYFILRVIQMRNLSSLDIFILCFAKFLIVASTFTTGRFLYLYHIGTVIALCLYRKDIRFSFKTQLGCVLMAFVVFPVLLFFMNLIRHGYYNEIGEVSVLDAFSALKADLNPGHNLKLLIEYTDKSDFNYGIFLMMIPLSLIPRAIWPSKPIMSSQFYYTQEVFNIDPIKDVTTFTFTIYDFYAIAGHYLVPIMLFISGAAYAIVYNTILRTRSIALKVFFITVTIGCINVFRTNLQDAIFLMFFNCIISIVVINLFERCLVFMKKGNHA